MLDSGKPSEWWHDRLNRGRLELCFSDTNFLEFGKIFYATPLDSKKAERGRRVFSFIDGLNINLFVKETPDLLATDVALATTGERANPFLGTKGTDRAQKELRALARGDLSDKGSQYIRDREEGKRNFYPTWGQRIREKNPIPSGVQLDLAQMLAHTGSRQKLLLKLLPQVSTRASEELSADMSGRFPFISSCINAHIWAHFIFLTQPTSAKSPVALGWKRNEDFLHLIESNAADLFFIDDEKAFRRAAELTAWRKGKIMRWKQLQEMVGF